MSKLGVIMTKVEYKRRFLVGIVIHADRLIVITAFHWHFNVGSHRQILHAEFGEEGFLF